MAEFVMPSLGADMDEGTLLEWLVAPGDRVHRGDVIAVVDTAKSAIDVEVFTDGVVEELLVDPGTTVPVGTPLARLGAPSAAGAAAEAEAVAAAAEAVTAPAAVPPAGAAASRPAQVSPVVRHLAHERGVDLATVTGTGPEGAVTRGDVLAAAVPAPAAPTPAAATPAATAVADTGRVRASPFARRRAAELGVDLTSVAGTGPEGVATVADVEQAAAAAAARPAAPAGEAPAPRTPRAAPVPPSGGPAADARAKQAAMRRAIGDLMARSKREIPHYYLQATVDLAASVDWLRAANAGRGVEERLVPAALLLKATAVAARRHHEVNGFYVDGAFAPAEHVHLGVAVALRGGGLVAPAIHDADTLALDDLMAALKDLVARARAGRLRGSEMSDPTLTVTNLGDQGVDLVHGVIYPPQVALVGFGRVVERPWAVDGMLAVRPVVTLTLAADHRVTDGHLGGRFLAAIADSLQHPETLALADPTEEP